MKTFVDPSMGWPGLVLFFWLPSCILSGGSDPAAGTSVPFSLGSLEGWRPRSGALAGPRNVSLWIVGDVDAAVDEAMLDVVRLVREGNLDPLSLGDLGTPDLHDCRIGGLSSVRRAGSWEAILSENDTAAEVTAVVGFDRLAGSCRFSKRLLFVEHRGTVILRAEGATATVLVRQVLRGEARPDLRSLDLDFPGDVELEVRGNGALAFVLDTLQSLYRRRMKRLVRDALQRRCRDLLSAYMARVTLDDIEWAYGHRNYSFLLDDPSSRRSGPVAPSLDPSP